METSSGDAGTINGCVDVQENRVGKSQLDAVWLADEDDELDEDELKLEVALEEDTLRPTDEWMEA